MTDLPPDVAQLHGEPRLERLTELPPKYVEVSVPGKQTVWLEAETAAQVQLDAQRLALWPELLRQLDRASDLLSVCDLDAPSDVADMADIRQTLARARELK
jgi:hypothetical protein